MTLFNVLMLHSSKIVSDNRAIYNTARRAKQLTGSAVITHDVTTGTGYCLVGFNWIIDFFN